MSEMDRRDFLTKLIPTALIGAAAFAVAPSVLQSKPIVGELLITERDLAVGWGPEPAPEINVADVIAWLAGREHAGSEADVMVWLMNNGYTTRETTAPFQRMNKTLMTTSEGIRITYVWDQEPGFSWDQYPIAGEESWHHIANANASGYQLRSSGHRETP